MSIGVVDPSGADPAYKAMYTALQDSGVVDSKTGILDVYKMSDDTNAVKAIQKAYTNFIVAMKKLGYTAISIDNMEFYNTGPNASLSKQDQHTIGMSWQAMVASLIHAQGMYAIAKNAPELVGLPKSTYVQNWDAIVTEDAKTPQWDDTAAYKAFADAGKPVWNFQSKISYNTIAMPNWLVNYVVKSGSPGWIRTN